MAKRAQLWGEPLLEPSNIGESWVLPAPTAVARSDVGPPIRENVRVWAFIELMKADQHRAKRVALCSLEPEIEPSPFGVTDGELAWTGSVRAIDHVRQPAPMKDAVVSDRCIPAILSICRQALL